MDGLSLVPYFTVIPDRVIVYPLLGNDAFTVLVLVLSSALLGGAVRYRHELGLLWSRRYRRPLRVAHA